MAGKKETTNKINNLGKILVLDDEDIIHLTLKRILEEDGYFIASAYNADDALTKIQSDFDLLISDIRLGGMDGIEVLQQLRKNKNDVEVIMLTGFATLDSATQAINYGARGYIMKPIEDIEGFRNKVKEAIQYSHLKRENKLIFDAIHSGKLDFFEGKSMLPIDLKLLEGDKDVLQKLLQLLPEAIIVVDTDRKILFCNISFADLLGKPYRALTESKIDDLVSMGCKKSFCDFLINLKNSEEVKSTNVELVSSLDKLIAFEISALPLFHEREYSGAVLIMAEKSELEKVKQKAELLAKLVEESKYDMMFMLNHNGIVHICNALARNTFGYGLNEIIGLNINSLMQFGQDQNLKSVLEHLNKTPRWTGIVTGISKTRVEFPIELSMSKVSNRTNEDEIIICSMRIIKT